MTGTLRNLGFHPQFLHGFGQNLLVSFITHIGDEAALFGPQKITGTADIQILHGNVEAAAQVREFFNGPQAPAGIVRNGNKRRHNEIAESLLIRPAHTVTLERPTLPLS